MAQPYRYWAFISYNHHDRRWARWLHRRLETWRVPRHLIGRTHRDGNIPARLMPIFRDRDELPSAPSLGDSVQQALRESRYLIVVCSPQAAASKWVNEEVESFKAMGRGDRILCWRIEPSSRHGDCFPPALMNLAPAVEGAAGASPGEPLAADVHADGRDASVLKLLAGMLGIGYDELRRREYRRQLQRRILLGLAGVAMFLLTLAGWHWQQQEKRAALQEQALQVRIKQLYRAGREELLARNESRAAVYLNEAYRLGLDTPALRYLLARAMAVVDAQRLRIDTGSPVWLADISPDGSRLFALSDDRHLRSFDLQQGTKLFDVDVGDMRSFYASYSPTGSLIWLDSTRTEQASRQLRLFDAHDGHLLKQVDIDPDASSVSPPPLDDSDRYFAYVAPDRAIVVADRQGGQQKLLGQYSVTRFCRGAPLLIAGRSDGVTELHALRAGLPLVRSFTGLQSAPSLVDSTPGCAELVEGTQSGEVRVWNVDSRAVQMSSGHKQPITELRFSAGGERLMTMTRASVGVWDGRSGALIFADRFLSAKSNLATMRTDGHAIARLGDGRLSVIDVDTGAEMYSLDGHRGGASAFNFASDGRQIISGGGDGTVIVWRQPQRLLAEYSRASAAAGEARGNGGPLVFSHDGQRYFAASPQPAFHASNTLQSVLSVQGADAAAELAVLSADDRLLAMGMADGTLGIWDATTGEVLRRWHSFQERPLHLSLDSTGRYLAEAIRGHRTRLLDRQSGAELRVIQRDYPQAVALSPLQPLLAVGDSGTVMLSELASGQPHWTLRLPDGADQLPITVVAFSPDGRRLLVTSRREHAYLLDVSDGHVIAQLHQPASVFFGGAVFSADGRSIVIADGNNSALLWKLDSQRHLVLGGHSAEVRAVSFSDDNALVVSVGADGVAKIWDAGNGELLDSFTVHDGEADWDFADFSPDDRALVTGGSDGYTRLWSVARETRSAAQLARVLRCRVPWTLEDNVLRASAFADKDCSESLAGE